MKPWTPPVPQPTHVSLPADTSGNHVQRKQIRSDDLFSGQREVLIEHAGELYSLRHTSKGKLILTK
jgi:hemin uptake protein HemP